MRDASILDEMRSLHAAYPARSRLQFAKRLVSYAVLCALQHPLVLGAGEGRENDNVFFSDVLLRSVASS